MEVLQQSSQWIDLLRVTVPAAIAVAGTLAGSFVGHRNAKVQAREAKSVDFVERQVREFYSPMVGCLKRIRALSSLREEISDASNKAWLIVCDQHPRPFLDHEKYFEPFKAVIEHDNKQLYAEILPNYDRMVQLFTENYWLASKQVQTHYAELCRFVEIWNRYRARTIPAEALEQLEHTEARLEPFYSLLESELYRLRAVVAFEREA